MKKILLTFALFILPITLAGCGGGAGSSSQPSGVDAGVPSVIQVLPVQSIVQTNSYIPVKVRVLDGNGNILRDITVTFTNLSLVGTLSATTAKTDQLGFATVNLFSTISGFSTVQAEVNTGAGMVRDKRTVFFSDYDLTVPSEATTATLTLDVDGDGDGIYNEPSDFILFENPDDSEVLVRATFEMGNIPQPGYPITFGADSPEATFPLALTDANDQPYALTDTNGEATILVKVDPIMLRTFNTVLNITAYASDSLGNTLAANVISLFLDPVVVDNVSVGADPQTVDSGSTSKITAQVSTTAGSAAPDGTAVSFSATNGSVSPFGQTTDGAATATFTAPKLSPGAFDQQATVTASSGGKSDTVNLTIVAPSPTPAPTPAPTPTPTPVPTLAVTPTTTSISCGGVTATFFVTGGVPQYTVVKQISADPVNLSSVAANGSFTVTSAACGSLPASTPVTILVKDSASGAVSVTVTVTNP